MLCKVPNPSNESKDEGKQEKLLRARPSTGAFFLPPKKERKVIPYVQAFLHL